MRKLFLALMCFMVLGCTTIRMKYESMVNVEGTTNRYTYVNSYPVGGAYSSLCYLTAILWGGTCWYYTVMPTVNQKSVIIEEAQNKLAAQLAGKKFEELDLVSVSKVSYEAGAEEISIIPLGSAGTP